jgi:ketosteroid isomerase-like protein
MKNSIVLVLVLASCSRTIDTEKEKAAVLAVLQEEGDAFSASDMNRIAATHTANKQDIRLIWDGSGMKRYEGWDQIKGLYEEYMAHPLPSEFKNSKEEAVVRVGNGSAWVVCDNTWKSTQDGKENSFTNVQVAFLEKQQGKWKVAFNAFAPRTVPESIDGVYEYLAPSKGMAIMRNGKFVYVTGGSDASNGNAGNYELVGNSIKNTITYHTDPKQIGTSFWWKVESWSGDTLTYALLDDKGQTTWSGRAVRVGL